MPDTPDPDFYDLSPPEKLQQGDLIANAPLIYVPESQSLLLVRDAEDRPLSSLSEGQAVTLRAERERTAYSAAEYGIVKVRRGLALIATQTCDLNPETNWLVCPVFPINSNINEGQLLSTEEGKQNYINLFGLSPHPPDFEKVHYADLAGMASVYGGAIEIKQRVACVTRPVQESINAKIAQMFSRAWGHAAGDDVPKDGQYRCLMCVRFFGIEISVVDLKQGDKFPGCRNCERIKKAAQWYPLRKHKR